MAKPLVSVILDNCNYAPYLGLAIESALQQNYPNRQIIVVDDGSTDESAKVLDKYEGRITCIRKPNGGQASAFNTGFAAAHGELVCFLDADDCWLGGKLSHIVRAAERNPSAVIICHPVQPVSADGSPNGRTRPMRIPSGCIRQKVLAAGGYWRYPPTSGLCFRRGFLEQVMPIPEGPFRTCADSYLATLAPLLGDVVGLSQPLARYRIHGANLWASNGEGRMNPNDRVLRAWNEGRRLKVLTEQVNQKLCDLGAIHRLSLENHFPYGMLRRSYDADVALVPLIWRGLCWGGDSLPIRLKMVANNLRRLFRPVLLENA